ncbi:hypothetical protein Tco_0616553 [Tanacetum coccineum]
MAKPILNETQTEQNIAEPRVESNVKFEFGKEFVTELQSNTFSGRCEQDVIVHIGKVLEILDLVKIAGARNYDKICDDDEEGRDPLKFIPWRNSKFKDHKNVDETTKRALLHTWIEIGNQEGLLNDEVSSDEEWEEHEYGNH